MWFGGFLYNLYGDSGYVTIYYPKVESTQTIFRKKQSSNGTPSSCN